MISREMPVGVYCRSSPRVASSALPDNNTTNDTSTSTSTSTRYYYDYYYYYYYYYCILILMKLIPPKGRVLRPARSLM